MVVALGVFVDRLPARRTQLARPACCANAFPPCRRLRSAKPAKNLALLRDEMLSKIPALDNLLRRSARISNLQTMLEQADVKSRAGNVLLLCLVSGAVLGLVGPVCSAAFRRWLGWAFCWACSCPILMPATRRSKRFQKFEELFPEAIDTLARAVRAGHAFTTALELIANEIARPRRLRIPQTL